MFSWAPPWAPPSVPGYVDDCVQATRKDGDDRHDPA
jgi:hypothetical protein